MKKLLGVVCCLPALALASWAAYELRQILGVIVGVIVLVCLTGYGIQCITEEPT